MPRVLGYGDSCLDIYVEDSLCFPGGNAVNVAVHAARLGAVSAYIGYIGNDWAGEIFIDSLTREGVDIRLMGQLVGVTPWAKISHRNGDRVFGGSDAGVMRQFRLLPEHEAALQAYDLVHTSVHSHIEHQLGRIAPHCARLSYDLSEHWRERDIEGVLTHADIVFVSGPEEQETILDRLMAMRPEASRLRELVLTRGGRGIAAHIDGRVWRQDVVPVDVVDTLGAGDGLIAGYLMARLRGAGPAAALASGAACAAAVCRTKGAFGYGHALPIPHPEIEGTRPCA